MERTRVYYINLDRDKGRRKGIESELAREGIEAERFPGIDARSLTKRELEGYLKRGLLAPDRRWTLASSSGHRHWGRLGVHLSHYLVWRGFLDNQEGREFLLILEDDIVLARNFSLLYEEALRVAPPDWEVLFLSSADRIVGKKVSPHYVDPVAGHAPFMNHGLFTYVVRASAIPKLIALAMPVKFKLMHLDHIIREHYGRLRAYYLIQRITQHRNEITSSREQGNGKR